MRIKSIKLFLIIIFYLSSITNLVAQNQTNFNPAIDDISENLPPLNILIDSALVNDPYVHFRDLQLIVENSKLKANRINWTENLGIEADLNYGNYNDISTSISEEDDAYDLVSNTTQTTYSFGAYLKLPIYDIINRKNSIRQSKAEIRQAECMAEVKRKEVRQLVITQYNELVLKQRLFKIRAKHLAANQINYEMTEKEFHNGVVSVGELSRISDMYSTSEEQFESARTDFVTSYLILEEIVGFKFNIANF